MENHFAQAFTCPLSLASLRPGVGGFPYPASPHPQCGPQISPSQIVGAEFWLESKGPKWAGCFLGISFLRKILQVQLLEKILVCRHHHPPRVYVSLCVCVCAAFICHMRCAKICGILLCALGKLAFLLSAGT